MLITWLQQQQQQQGAQQGACGQRVDKQDTVGAPQRLLCLPGHESAPRERTCTLKLLKSATKMFPAESSLTSVGEANWPFPARQQPRGN